MRSRDVMRMPPRKSDSPQHLPPALYYRRHSCHFPLLHEWAHLLRVLSEKEPDSRSMMMLFDSTESRSHLPMIPASSICRESGSDGYACLPCLTPHLPKDRKLKLLRAWTWPIQSPLIWPAWFWWQRQHFGVMSYLRPCSMSEELAAECDSERPELDKRRPIAPLSASLPIL